MSILVRFNPLNTGKKRSHKETSELIPKENFKLYDQQETPKKENKLELNKEITKHWKEFQKVKKGLTFNLK